jgi:tetratricopeptide (TPR) repeat protein
MTISRRGKRMTTLPCRRKSDHLLKMTLLLTLTMCGLTCCVAQGQTDPRIASVEAQIARNLASIHTAEQQHLPQAQQGALWGKVALEYQSIAVFQKAEDAYNRSLHMLKNAPAAGPEYASTLDNLATLYLSYDRVDDAESTEKQALMERKKLGKLSEIGLSEIRLADVALVRHQYNKAEQQAQRAIADMESAPEPPITGMLSAFITLAYARCSRGHCDAGMTSAEQAVEFANKMFGPESAATGFAFETLGFAKWKSGDRQEGEKAMLQALKILKTRLAAGDPRLAGVMLQYRTFLLEAHRTAEAQDLQQQVTTITRQAGLSCPSCSISVHSLENSFR